MVDKVSMDPYIQSVMLAESLLHTAAVVDPKTRWYPHKMGFIATPNWVVVEYVQVREIGICVSLYQGPEPLDVPEDLRRPGRPGYVRAKITEGLQVNRMYPALMESFRRYMARADKGVA